jgi:hypothetical protein
MLGRRRAARLWARGPARRDRSGARGARRGLGLMACYGAALLVMV